MAEFFTRIERLAAAVGDAEYRFLLLEPFLFFGLAIGVVMLVIGFAVRAARLRTVAVLVIGIAAAAHIPHQSARLAAQPRVEQVYEISAPARAGAFKENTLLWVESAWKFKLLMLAAGAALLVGVNTNRLGQALAVSAALLGLAAAKDALWLHYQDAVAHHPNLRVHAPPVQMADTNPPADAPVARQRSEPEQGPARSAPGAAPSAATRAMPLSAGPPPPPAPEDRAQAPPPPAAPPREVRPFAGP